MGCPARNYHDWQSASGGGGGSPFGNMPVVPAPMVGMGMLMGLVLGLLLGMMFGKKHAMAMMHGGGHGGMRWHKSMMHHHHGFGMQGCCSEHRGDESEMGAMDRPEGGPATEVGEGI